MNDFDLIISALRFSNLRVEAEAAVDRIREESKRLRLELGMRKTAMAERIRLDGVEIRRLQALADSRLGKMKALKNARSKLGKENERLRAVVHIARQLAAVRTPEQARHEGPTRDVSNWVLALREALAALTETPERET